MSGSLNEGWGIECACSDVTATKRQRKSSKRRRLKRKSKLREKRNNNGECAVVDQNRPENEIFRNNGERSSTDGEDGEDGGEGRKQRSRCRQRELNPYLNEIDTACVTGSRDLTSKSAVRKLETDHQTNKGKGNCPGNRSLRASSVSMSTCSEGSYSRRKHHKHLKHKHKDESKNTISMNDSSVIHPKVNPVFVWVRQEDSRIVEVLCEDYDYKNRLKLRRTHLGWRAIPKTKRFADALLPKAMQSEVNESLSKPKKTKICKRWKKAKKSKKGQSVKKGSSNDRIEEVNSVAETNLPTDNDNVSVESHADDEQPPTLDSSVSSNLKSEFANDCETRSRALIKSNSCDFSTLRVRKNLIRSTSLDLNYKCDPDEFCLDDVVVKKGCDIYFNPEQVPNNDNGDISKSETEEKVESDDANEYDGLMVTEGSELRDSVDDDRRNHSEPIVMDMTKHDSDFNDADCEELGQLLKVIPDLEFVHEDELEEVDEEEWLAPTDLTLPKTPRNEKVANDNLPNLSLNISPLVTVTSAAKSAEPLTAPLPEVTITPIPKPAHQKKPENNFLEHLLSSTQNVKPEVEERSRDGKSSSDISSRKASKHPWDGDVDGETKHKKLKSEDITLKSLLSKQCKQGKGMDLEKCVQNLKALNVRDCSKSRLHELLTKKNPSDPISELKEVLSDPHLAVPDPLLVPRARLPALVASPASEIPRLLTMHFEKTIEEKVWPPIKDSDVLEVSLSNLESLLSGSPEASACTNHANVKNYQKSLETLLGWQKYQSDLIETQMKNSKNFPPGYTGDMATATALSQMLWLPYLNQFDFNANRNIMSLMNSMFTGDYRGNESQLSSPPRINISQVPQPSPFLTPTSPMDIESHLKTLAMWQEAVSSQPSFATRPSSKSSPVFSDGRSHHLLSTHLKGSHSSRKEVNPSNVDFHDYQKRYRHGGEPDHTKLTESHQRSRRDHSSQSKKPFKAFGNHQNEEQSSRFSFPDHVLPPTSLKSVSNTADKISSSSKKRIFKSDSNEFKSDRDLTDDVALRLQQFNTEIHKTTGSSVHSKRDKSNSSETPKLKVKNLVDPSMSPPKLLKQIGPEDLVAMNNDAGEPAQDDNQGHIWHPLFGSNQIKMQPYNSPWRWTTVTVNGE